jgi:hypothetical protein
MKQLLHSIPPAILTALILVACGSSRPAPSAASLRSLDAARAAVGCARRHGMPNVPDPRLGANGQVTIPGGTPVPTPAVQLACAAQIRATQPSGSTDAVESAADIRALVRVSACMRVHGYPHWPDPNDRGELHVPSAEAGTPVKMGRALAACNRLFPASGWHLTVTPSGS